ncbi:hypothetical protein [Halomonas denitrificans]|nr:hypothetical protein [Halomonas denitrificans]
MNEYGTGSSDRGIEDSELDARLSTLTREAPPPASAWAGIAERIRPRRRGRHVRWGLLAAAAVLLVAVVVVRPPPDERPAGIDGGRILVAAETEAMRRVAPTVTGGLIDTQPLAASWAENQVAIDELEAALDRDPDNRLLLEFLAEARMRQVRLLNSGLAVRGRTDA